MSPFYKLMATALTCQVQLEAVCLILALGSGQALEEPHFPYWFTLREKKHKLKDSIRLPSRQWVKRE